MMYTPSPPSKRPRPPSSAAHIRMRKTSLTAATSQPLGAMGLSSMPSDQTIVGHGEHGAGPSIRRISGERGHGSGPMDSEGRTTPSPQSEAAEVSFALDGLPRPVATPPLRPASLVLDNIARQEAIPPAQASPPPPYGQDLPSESDARRRANTDRSRDERSGTGTPPCQDSAQTSNTPSLGGDPDDNHSEEALRLKRAADAAKAMGLDIDFGMSSDASASGDESDDLPGSEVKRKLRDVKHQLKQRDQELIMAARVAQEVLHEYEAVVSRLSPSARDRLPGFLQLLAAQPMPQPKSRSSSAITPRPTHRRQASNRSIMSIDSMISPTLSQTSRCVSPEKLSPPARGLRTLRMVEGLTAKPRRVGLSKRAVRASDPPLEQELYYAQLQQADMDARIAELEAALADAQEGQEAQRRAAARLRKENEAVHRNLARAEGLLVDSNTLRGLPVPSARSNRPAQGLGAREGMLREPAERGSQRNRDDSAGGARPVLSRQSSLVGDVIDSLANRPSYASLAGKADAGRSRSTSPTLSEHSPSSRSTIKLSAPKHGVQVAPHLIEPRRVRKKVSPSAFLSPARANRLPASPASPQKAATQSTRSKRIVTPQVKIDPPESEPSSSLRIRRLSHKSSRSSLSSTRSSASRMHARSLSGPRRSRAKLHPSPSPRPQSPAESIMSIASLASRLSASASPGYTSVSSTMASMRHFVAQHLGHARTLGSELGSEWGGMSPDSASSRLHPYDGTATSRGYVQGELYSGGEHEMGDEAEWEDEVAQRIPDDEAAAFFESLLSDAKHVEEDESEGGEGSPSSSPAILPPQISAALSSMASAMGRGGIDGFWPAGADAHGRLARRHSRAYLQSATTRETLAIDMEGLPRRGSRRKQGKDEWVDLHPVPTPTKSRLSMLTASKSPLLRKSRFMRSPGPLLLRRMIKAEPTVEGDIFSPTSSSFEAGSNPSPRLAEYGRGTKSGRKRSNVEESVVVHPGRQDQTARGSGSNETGSNADDWIEPRTVPGRLVHDLFVWAIIALEWTVYVFVLLVKMGLDLQEGKQGIMAKNRNDKRRKRYYL